MRFVREMLFLTVLIAGGFLEPGITVPFFCDPASAITEEEDMPDDAVTDPVAKVSVGEDLYDDGSWMAYENIILTWGPTSSGKETGYEIWATTSPGKFERIGTVDAGVTEYTDQFVDTKYREVEAFEYRVRAVFGDRAGPFSNAVEVKNLENRR